MLVARDEVVKRITDLLEENITNLFLIKKIKNKLVAKYNISELVATDITSLRTSCSNQSDFILFCFIDVISEVCNVSYSIETFFTEVEIASYKNMRMPESINAKDIEFEVIEIVPDEQFIGIITNKQLQALTDAQLINYNSSTQRKLIKKVFGDIETYSIDINEKSVSSIMEALRNGVYIPTPITLNLGDDYEDFSYDPNTHKFKIGNGCKKLDIIDGYHRYRAITTLNNTDVNFECTMMVQFVFWPEQKAQDYIYQEDQKNPLKKSDSKSLNRFDEPNIIVKRINSVGTLTGKINRTEKAIIDSTMLSTYIDVIYYYLNGVKRRSNKFLLKRRNIIIKRIQKYIEILLENRPELMENRWEESFIAAVVFATYLNCEDNEILSIIDLLYSNMNIDSFNFTGRRELSNRIYFNRFVKLAEECNLWNGGDEYESSLV